MWEGTGGNWKTPHVMSSHFGYKSKNAPKVKPEAGDMAQMVECLLSMYRVLGLIPRFDHCTNCEW